MKVIIAGGSGFLGQILAKHFIDQNYEVVILSRSQSESEGAIRYVNWNGKDEGIWVDEMEGSSVIINLSGKNIDCRHTPQNRKLILDSRLDSTTIIGAMLSKLDHPPKLWINASGAGIYVHTQDKPHDDESTQYGTDFMAEVCKKWEDALYQFNFTNIRQVALRTSVIFGRGEGAWVPLHRLAKIGLGGQQGNGKQMVSWMHEKDYVRAVQFIIDHDNMNGSINMTAPNPLSNAELMRSIRKAIGMPIGLPAFEWMIKLGAFFMKTEADLILNSSYVEPKRLIQAGFDFKYPEFTQAVKRLISK